MMIRYYKNNFGNYAKLMRTNSAYIVMTAYKTMFFTSEHDAKQFLTSHNYT